MLDKQHLLKIARTPMPFGKYQGRMLVDLPEEYLLWFYKKGFPPGELERLMQLTLELKIDGLDGLLKPLRPPPLRRRMTSPTLSADTLPTPCLRQTPAPVRQGE